MQEPTESGSLNKSNNNLPDFAPADPTDNRKPGDWRTRYTDSTARRDIYFEAAYLLLFLVGIPIVLVIFWLDYPKSWLGISDEKYRPILKYGVAWLSGALGGAVFGMKWLYHVVARQFWNQDRRLWRFCTPLISGSLSFVIVALISSEVFRIINRQAVQSLSMTVGVAFLVGYFSDNAVAKLTKLAKSIFGDSRDRDK